MCELSALMSEGWNGFSLLLTLSFPGEHLEKIIPLIVRYCNVEDDELREYCFQAFESFVRRCVPSRNSHAPCCATCPPSENSICSASRVEFLSMCVPVGKSSSQIKYLLHVQSWA